MSAAPDDVPVYLPIPPSGWERPTVDPDTDAAAWAWDSLRAAISPAPGFLYDAATEAARRESPIRMHPAELARMRRASWATRIEPGGPVLGVEVVADPAVPEGSIRLDAARVHVRAERARQDAADAAKRDAARVVDQAAGPLLVVRVRTPEPPEGRVHHWSVVVDTRDPAVADAARARWEGMVGADRVRVETAPYA